MNSISMLVFPILFYLGVGKILFPLSNKTVYIPNHEKLASHFPNDPVSIILEKRLKKGFFIHTYILQLKIIKPFQQIKTIKIQTSKNYWKSLKDNIGMSLMRRYNDRVPLMETKICPPGTMFLNNPKYGSWFYLNSGKKKWKFNKTYQYLSKALNWGKFLPSKDFFMQNESYKNKTQIFYGLNFEFGTKGFITSKFFKKEKPIYKKPNKGIYLHFKELFKIPTSQHKDNL